MNTEINIKNYEEEILAIAKAQNVTFDIAVQMFLNNVEDAFKEDDKYDYSVGSGLDYKALKPYEKELREQSDEYIADFYKRLEAKLKAEKKK